MNVILTGPTSFIGIALINQLLASDCNITAISRPNSSGLCNLPKHPRLNIVESQLYELGKLTLDGKFDVLFHIGWSSDFENPRFNLYDQLLNANYSNQAVELAHKCGCEAFLAVGSQAECGRVDTKISAHTPDNPETAYATTKCSSYFQTKYLCEQYGMRLLWSRLLSSYGVGDRPHTLISQLIATCKNKTVVDLTPCEQIWDYVNVKDVANALVCIAEKGKHGVKYPIGSGIGLPLIEYVSQIAKICDYPQLLDGIGKKPYADNQVMNLHADLTQITNDVGFVPIISFEQGIEEIWSLD